MNFNAFLNKHWEVFLSHVCEFHPIDNRLITKFEYELDWIAISKNETLNWTIDFIEKYEDRFVWHELAWNSGISWTTEFIKKFNKRLDWYYLGRNIRLPISETFIKEHYKNMFIIESNIFLTEELKKLHNKELLPAFDLRHDLVLKEDLENIDKLLAEKNEKLDPNSKSFYKNYILKELGDKDLINIFERKFDYSQRYFYFDAVRQDIFGLTPEFVVDGSNPFQHFREDRNIIDIKNRLKLINGSLQEGKARLFEMPRFSTFSYSPVLLVSENIKVILEQFNLPEHSFTLVDLKPKKITTKNKFYLFQLNHDTLTKDLDYSAVDLHYRIRDGITDFSSTYSEWTKIEIPVKDQSQLAEYIENIRKKVFAESVMKSVVHYPTKFLLKTNYDIYSYSVHRKFIVTERLKKVLEKYLPKQVNFHSAQLLEIKQDQEIYDQKLSEIFDLDNLIKPVTYISAAEELFYFEKMKRLEETHSEIPVALYTKDEFEEIEKQLNIIIPEKFKKKYRKGTPDESYEFLPISAFYIQNEYADRLPETFHALIFAENGCGDSLGLLLDKKSDFKLHPQIYEFLHETGEVEKFDLKE